MVRVIVVVVIVWMWSMLLQFTTITCQLPLSRGLERSLSYILICVAMTLPNKTKDCNLSSSSDAHKTATVGNLYEGSAPCHPSHGVETAARGSHLRESSMNIIHDSVRGQLHYSAVLSLFTLLILHNSRMHFEVETLFNSRLRAQRCPVHTSSLSPPRAGRVSSTRNHVAFSMPPAWTVRDEVGSEDRKPCPVRANWQVGRTVFAS